MLNLPGPTSIIVKTEAADKKEKKGKDKLDKLNTRQKNIHKYYEFIK